MKRKSRQSLKENIVLCVLVTRVTFWYKRVTKGTRFTIEAESRAELIERQITFSKWGKEETGRRRTNDERFPSSPHILRIDCISLRFQNFLRTSVELERREGRRLANQKDQKASSVFTYRMVRRPPSHKTLILTIDLPDFIPPLRRYCLLYQLIGTKKVSFEHFFPSREAQISPFTSQFENHGWMICFIRQSVMSSESMWW